MSRERNPAVAEAVSALLRTFAWNGWFTDSFWPENEHRVTMMAHDVLALAPPPRRLLDIGCANGFNSFLFSKLGYTVTGTDSSAVPERPALFEREGIAFFYANLNDPDALAGLADASFDAVLMGEVIEHILNHPLGLMREVARVLKPGGPLVLTTPNPSTLANAVRVVSDTFTLWGTQSFIDEPKIKGGRATDIGDVHFREYRSGEVRHLLEGAGFDILRTEYFAFGQSRTQSRLKRAAKVLSRPASRFRPFGANQYVLARKAER